MPPAESLDATCRATLGKPFAECRFLEVGERPHLSLFFPGQFTFLAASKGGLRKVLPDLIPPKVTWHALDLATFREYWRRISAGEFDFVVGIPCGYALWRPQSGTLSNLIYLLRTALKDFGGFGLQVVRACAKSEAPLAVLDLADRINFSPRDRWILQRANAVFRRELPCQQWAAFIGMHRYVGDIPSARRCPECQAIQAKLHPCTLRLLEHGTVDPDAIPEKTSDFFFAGSTVTSTVRAENAQLIDKLKARGITVDVPEGRLPREEFLKRCGQAWLVWSPEGNGWDCHRHTECIEHGSLPLMNYPNIKRYAPLVHGETALFYATEGDDMVRVVEAALADKDKLRSMTRAARRHINQHFHPAAFLDYVLRQTAKPNPLVVQ